MWCKCLHIGACNVLYAKVFQSDRILSNTNGFIFQIISSLIETMGNASLGLTVKICFFVVYLFICFSLGLLFKALYVVSLWKQFCHVSSYYFSRVEHGALENSASRPDTVYSWTLANVVVLLFLLAVGTESGNASRSLTDRFNGPGMEKLQETSSGLAGVVARNKQVRFCETVCYWLKIK